MKWTLLLLFVVAVTVFVNAEDDDYSDFEEDDDDFSNSGESSAFRVVRSAQISGRPRGSNRRVGKACRYTKGPWSDCDQATNMRSRTLTLKKGDTSCETTKTITKKCKKAGSRRRN